MALNMVRQLEQRLVELPRNCEIVAYCRGSYCVLSFEAVAALRVHGFNVRRVEDGFPEWKVSGIRLKRRPKRPGIPGPASEGFSSKGGLAKR